MASSSRSSRVVLVTGCSRPGIATALCEQFASRGCSVYALVHDPDKVMALPAIIARIACDSGSDDSVSAAVNQVIERHGKIDVLVNGATVGRTGALLDVPVDIVQRDFAFGVFDVLRLIKAVVPHMATRRSGLVVNVGSVAGQIASPWGGISGSSKAALHSLTDTLDMELRPLGVHVTLLVPGLVSSSTESDPTSINMPETSLYSPLRTNVSARLAMSGSTPTMPTAEFARQVVDQLLSRRPPRFISLGALAWQARVLLWLPRSVVLFSLWFYFFKLTSIFAALGIVRA